MIHLSDLTHIKVALAVAAVHVSCRSPACTADDAGGSEEDASKMKSITSPDRNIG